MTKRLTVIHLYPAEMNTYGDSGNVVVLLDRLGRRGLEHELLNVGVGDKCDLRAADIVFAGGGQDAAQQLVAGDLQARKDSLARAAREGVVMLAVCGAFQLFGRRFLTSNGAEIPGIGLFEADTVGSDIRMIGDAVVDSPFGQLVGFENHSGQTRLSRRQQPLGTVIRGCGNDGVSRREGAVSHNVIGTYLHGPLLSKNPAFADALLLTALRRKYGVDELEPLDDELEFSAARIASVRHLSRIERLCRFAARRPRVPGGVQMRNRMPRALREQAGILRHERCG